MGKEYYPLIPFRIGKGGRYTPLLDGLLDSGADNIIIPKSTANYLGLDLIEYDKPMHTAGGAAKCYTTRASIIIGRGGREIKYNNIEIFVADHDDVFHLIGKYPLFYDYDICFKTKDKTVIMSPAR